MNYDEAIKELIDLENNNNIGYGDLSERIRLTQEYKHVMLALETAKKEHELLGLYQELSKDLGLAIKHDTADCDDLPVDFEYLYVDTESENALETFTKITELERELSC